jgi:ubiquinone/menaquinone biosynthesis C-methylase UbiE
MTKNLSKNSEDAFNIAERLDFDKNKPYSRDFSYQEHIARYFFASQFVTGKNVLDIACGTTYGTAFLLNFTPNMLVGVDLSKEALNKGKKNFGRSSNLLAGDAANISFKEGAFDVVISFETIEHLMKYEKFVEETKRVLADKGLFIVSTPNKLAFSARDEMYSNKYHFKEFTLTEFHLLLSEHFSEIKLFGEGKMDTKYNLLRDTRKMVLKKTHFDLLKLNKLGAGRIFSKLLKPAAVYPLNTTEYLDPKFFIAICKKESNDKSI